MNLITYSNCGFILPDSNNSESVITCENCGGSNRTIHVSIEEKVIARDGLGLKAKRPGEKL